MTANELFLLVGIANKTTVARQNDRKCIRTRMIPATRRRPTLMVKGVNGRNDYLVWRGGRWVNRLDSSERGSWEVVMGTAGTLVLYVDLGNGCVTAIIACQ